MRKTILATLAIAFIALGTAVGVAKSDQIKGFFASEELYGKPAQIAETTAAVGATPDNTTLNEQTPAAGDEKTATDAAAPSAASDAVITEAMQDQPVTSDTAKTDEVKTDEAKTEEVKTDDAKKSTFVVDVARALKDREVGSKSAPLTVYDFSSMTCPHCAYFHLNIYPKVKEKYIDTGKVRWVFRGFPLNDPALRAEMLARCAPEDQYEKLISLMFQNMDRWAFTSDPMPNLNMLLRLAGINDDMFESCVNNKDLEKGLAAAAQVAGDKYKVAATPTFVFNDGAKNFSGAGTYEGFALDLDQTLQALAAPAAKPEMSTSSKLESKDEPAAASENPLAPKQ